jgi:hypothetical protein
MGIRTFIYCDYCNPNAIRFVDRRPPERAFVGGRRNSDSRSFIDGNDADAIAAGWKVVTGRHFCPRCTQHADYLQAQTNSSETTGASSSSGSGGLLGKLLNPLRSSK